MHVLEEMVVLLVLRPDDDGDSALDKLVLQHRYEDGMSPGRIRGMLATIYVSEEIRRRNSFSEPKHH